MSKDPYRYFRIEARELIDEMSSALLSLEKGGAATGELPKLLRLTHTLKGAARVVRQHAIADHAHAIEDALTPWRDGAQAVPGEALSPLLEKLDRIGELLAALDEPEATTSMASQPPTQAQTQAPAHAQQVRSPQTPANKGALKPPDDIWRAVRTDADELHAVLSGITESHVQVASLRKHLDATARASDLASLLLSQLTRRRGRDTNRAGAPIDLEAAKDMAEDLRATLSTLDAALSRTTDQLERELRQTRDTTEQLKLVPARQLFTSLARTVRDVAQMQGKQAVFTGQGGETRMDADVLMGVQAALVQMVRNAVAHGIEPPTVRQAAGKPVEGQVSLTVSRQGRHAVFTCSDDGAGIDADAITQTARRKGLLASDAPVDTQALLNLLLQGGVSTAHSVTEASGRGVGLNVVSDAMQRLGGELTLHTNAGQGTTLRLKVPLTLSSLAVLEVEAQGMRASIPLEAVRHALRLPTQAVSSSSEGDVVVHDGQALPFMPLSSAMLGLHGAKGADARPMWSMVIVQGDDGLAALGVDRLLGVTNIVMRPLPDLAPASPLIAGASLDVEGHPQIVLDPHHLVVRARTMHAPTRPDTAKPALPVLVIDDSLTTRMLEQSILESAGYTVHTAVSAEEGLELARQQRYALFLVDVDMPGMDGFGFVQTTRADPILQATPAILVTSRSSSQDRQRGLDAGAHDYIVKGEFAQDAFLDTIRRLTQPAS